MQWASLQPRPCRECSDRLSEFLDRELEDRERHAVALHLAGCEDCAQLAVDLAVTVYALHRLRRSPGHESDATLSGR